jgi:PEP-CTERM motif
MKLSTCMVAAVAALGLSDAGAGFVSRDFVIDDFSVLQSVSVAAGEVGGNTAGNGTTSCWYMATCYRDIVIDNSAAHHTTTASVVYNDQTPTLGPNYEFSAHVNAGDKARFIITWDGDTISGNFWRFLPGAPQGFPFTYWAPAFQPYIHPGIRQSGNPQITLSMLDMDGTLVQTGYEDFDLGDWRPDGYVAPPLFIDPRLHPDFDLDHVAAIQVVVTIDASDQAVDFALRRMKAPEPGSLVLAGLALAGLAATRRRSA